MKIGFVITGRMKSTRLPKKLTLKILDKEMIRWMIMRAKLAFDDNDIVIATSTNPQDDILEDIADAENIKIFRGDEDDVVLRLYNASIENNFDYIINITADCPLFGFDYIPKIKDKLIKDAPDLVTSLDLPIGLFLYAVKTSAFKKVIDIKKTNNTEVWGNYFYNNPDLFKTVALEIEDKAKKPYRLTIDYPEDFEMIKRLFNHFGDDTYKQTSTTILNFLDKNQEITEINHACSKKYQKRWNSQIATEIEKNKNNLD